uniref:FHA domain-containing protein n=1 Tax=Microbacterium sp. TaxID=51671 RepID=UPI00289BAEE5
IRPAPMPTPVDSYADTPAGVPAPAAAPAPPAPTDGLAGDGLVGDVDKTVVSPRPTDDDLDATVVVARKRGVRRSLVLDDGRTFALSGASVVIGRNPMGDPGEQRLPISDTTRTLSKTHARLVVHDDEWRLTDLHATNGVVVVEENGTETLLDPGESVTGNGRFILGEVGMHVVAERDS